MSKLVYYTMGGDAKVFVEATETAYIFLEGKPTIVEDVDLEFILSKTRVQGGCCGVPKTEVHIFEIAQES